MGGETPIDWVFTIEHSTWDVGTQHELASWSLRFIHLNLINLTSESCNGGSHGVEDIWKNKQLWKGLQRRSRVKSRKLNKTLHFLANPASSSIKWQNLNSSNLRERSLGGGGSIRLPGQELSWGELLSFCVFFVCLGGGLSFLISSVASLQIWSIPDPCLIISIYLMFQVSFRKGDTILLYAQVMSAAGKWTFGANPQVLIPLKRGRGSGNCWH